MKRTAALSRLSSDPVMPHVLVVRVGNQRGLFVDSRSMRVRVRVREVLDGLSNGLLTTSGLSTTKEGESLSARCSEQLNVCLSSLTDLRLSFSPGTKIRAELYLGTSRSWTNSRMRWSASYSVAAASVIGGPLTFRASVFWFLKRLLESFD